MYDKKLTTDSGVEVGHWMLTHRSDEYRNRKVWFVLGGFLNEECCKEGKAPLAECSYTITDVDPLELAVSDMWGHAMKCDAAAAAALEQAARDAQ